MRLYRFDALLNKTKPVDIVVAAYSEAEAFEAAEKELEKAFLKLPDIENLTLTNTRILRRSAAFVIQEEEKEEGI